MTQTATASLDPTARSAFRDRISRGGFSIVLLAVTYALAALVNPKFLTGIRSKSSLRSHPSLA